MASQNALSRDQASNIKALTSGEIFAIVKLASLGMNASAIEDYVTAVANDEDPGPPKVNVQPKPITIVAWNFVHDDVQYNGTYGLSSAEAGTLRDGLLTDTEDTLGKIQQIVSERVRRTGSQKPIVVIPDGIPKKSGKGAGGPPSNDGGLRLLKEEIRSNSGIYGSYKFTPLSTGNEGTHAFRVPLGGGLHTFAQSQQLAIAAARIVRVKGRNDPLVSRYVGFSAGGSTPKFGADISEKVRFDGRLGPGDAIPNDPSTRAATEAA